MEIKSILITGIAGFIGSNLGEYFTKNRPEIKITGVDNLHSNKFRNLLDINIHDYYHRDNILDALESVDKFDLIIHMGACSDTTESDEEFLISNNFNFSKLLLDYAILNNSKFIYASSAATYGLGQDFSVSKENEKPLNAYGFSKLIFDNYVREKWNSPRILPTVVGLRFFNVFGKNEWHKGKMSSVIYHFFNQFRTDGKIKIFGSYGGFAPGEHLRDFISVTDVIKVIDQFSEKNISGIFNLGTGHTATYNEVGTHVLNNILGQEMTTEYYVQNGQIEYIDFPAQLVGKYQSYTKADLKTLKESGLKYEPTPIKEAISSYVDILKSEA